MDKKVRRLLAANGWLGISVLVVTVVLIIVLSCFSENDLMTEMLDAFVDTVGQPSDTSPDYGGVVLVIVGVFFVFGAVFLLSASGLVFAGVGIKTLFDRKKGKQNALTASFAKRNIAVSSIIFVLDGAALGFMVCLLFSSWHLAEQVAAIGFCAVLLSCLAASVVLNGIVLSYTQSGRVSAEVF